jgi:prolyl-tRNA editing enzyme YbaK/EbsC (Cys-tRNA(Pro) deacylase)
MSLQSVRAHLARHGRDGDVIETPTSSATVALAAEALGVEPARIAKTLGFYAPDEDAAILVVAAGDARVHNAAFKARFGTKARMLKPEDVERLTGHAPGGVCPFANPPSARLHLDASLRRFETVFPACGSAASAIEVAPSEFETLCDGVVGWVDVTTVPD